MKFSFSAIFVSSLVALVLSAPVDGEGGATLSKRKRLNCSDARHHCVFVQGPYDHVSGHEDTDDEGTFLFDIESQGRVVGLWGRAPIYVAFGRSHSSATYGSGEYRSGRAYFTSRPNHYLTPWSEDQLITSDEPGDDLHVIFDERERGDEVQSE